MPAIYVDADGCPVKDEVYKVANRYQLDVHVVANRQIRVPVSQRIKSVIVGDEFDAADDWIADRASKGDIVITADLLLVDRCIKREAQVLGHKGRVYTQETIGDALATRELMADLRAMGETTGGPSGHTKRDRSRFLSALDELVQRLRNQS